MKSKNDTAKSSLDKCLRCGSACCRYLTVRLDTPRSILDFDNLLWKIYHENIQIFKDEDGWYLLINNACTNLATDGKCLIYNERPHACRDHSVDNCDADNPIGEVVEYYFTDASSLINYCKRRFKTWDRRHGTQLLKV